MGNDSLNDIFLSYAEEDGVTALRIYEDLTRAGLRVWRYERDSRVGTPISAEIREWIERSSVFCLLDSPKARRSRYIREECMAALELIQRGAELSFVICLAQPRSGPTADAWWEEELFEGLNGRSYIDLTDYGRGIRKLAEQLHVGYFPRFELPRDQDFEGEAHQAGLRYDMVAELVEMYRYFRERYDEERLDIAESQLRVLIDRCERAGTTSIVSPQLALGVLLAETGRHRDALKIFEGLVRLRGDDPRGWAGLAGARFHLGDCVKALEAYRRCQLLLEREPPERRAEIAHNVAMTLLALGRTAEAWAEVVSAPEEPYILGARGAALLAQGLPQLALPLLETAYQAYRRSSKLPLSLVIQLVDCYQALGLEQQELEVLEEALAVLTVDPELWRRAAATYLDRNQIDRALECLTSAVALAPGAIVYRAEHALLLRRTGFLERAQNEAYRCFSLEDESPREHYYRGLALYLLDSAAAAQIERRRSCEDPVIRTWPEYAELPGETSSLTAGINSRSRDK
jgi:tetratricopeptide (TPR) repeat protein